MMSYSLESSVENEGGTEWELGLALSATATPAEDVGNVLIIYSK